MSGVETFRFEPTYPPGEEPIESEEDEGEDSLEPCTSSVRTGNTEWCICGECISTPTADECYRCQELQELNQTFDDSDLCSLPLCSKSSTVNSVLHEVAIRTGPAHRPIFVIHTGVFFE